MDSYSLLSLYLFITLKIAKVLPLFKKNDYTIMDKYHPISPMTSISKLFEKVVFTQLYDYFRNNNPFYDSQYGFLKDHSTEYTLMELTDKILKAIDDEKYFTLHLSGPKQSL